MPPRKKPRKKTPTYNAFWKRILLENAFEQNTPGKISTRKTHFDMLPGIFFFPTFIFIYTTLSVLSFTKHLKLSGTLRFCKQKHFSSFYPTALKGFGVLFSPMASGWAVGRAGARAGRRAAANILSGLDLSNIKG